MNNVLQRRLASIYDLGRRSNRFSIEMLVSTLARLQVRMTKDAILRDNVPITKKSSYLVIYIIDRIIPLCVHPGDGLFLLLAPKFTWDKDRGVLTWNPDPSSAHALFQEDHPVPEGFSNSKTSVARSALQKWQETAEAKLDRVKDAGDMKETVMKARNTAAIEKGNLKQNRQPCEKEWMRERSKDCHPKLAKQSLHIGSIESLSLLHSQVSLEQVLQLNIDLANFAGVVIQSYVARQPAVIAQIQSLALQLNPVLGPYCSGQMGIRLHGSESTALALPLPDSDIDLSLECVSSDRGGWLISNLESLTLVHKVLEKDQSVYSLELISSTRVPIVKFTSPFFGSFLVDFDLGCNIENAAVSTQFFQSIGVRFPLFQSLVLAVKKFLKLHDLGSTFKGGIVSFLLQVMVLSQILVSIASRKC